LLAGFLYWETGDKAYRAHQTVAQSPSSWIGTETAISGGGKTVTTVRGTVLGTKQPLQVGAPKGFADTDSVTLPGALSISPTGELAVADGESLVIFDAQGQFIRRVGRKGRGPGEFVRIHGLWFANRDSLLIWDGVQRRLTWMSSAPGHLPRAIPMRTSAAFGTPEQIQLVPLLDSVALAWAGSLVRPGGPPDSVLLSLHSLSEPTGSRSLASLEGTSWKRYGPVPGPRYAFGPKTLFAVGRQGSVAFGDGVEYCFTLLATPQTANDPVSICRRWARARLGRAKDDLAENQLVNKLPMASVLRQLVREQEYSRTRNSYDELLIDDRNQTWVRVVDSEHVFHPLLMRQVPELRPQAYSWDVFDVRGRLLATVLMPARFRPRAIGTTSIVGVFEEDDGRLTLSVTSIPAPLLTTR